MATSELMSKALATLSEMDTSMSPGAIHGLVDFEEVTEPLSISAVAAMLDISPHTLRYYERCGLLSVDRDANDHRLYDAAAVRRLVFLTRMRLSGMSMRGLKLYIELVDRGDETVPDRLALLLEHRDVIRRQMQELQLSLTATEYKIATYGGATGP